MRLLIIYDIPSDRIRSHVADACLDYGLERIQYSAFVGVLGRAHARELELRIRRLIGRAPALVRFFPLDERVWERQVILERSASVEHALRKTDADSGGSESGPGELAARGDGSGGDDDIGGGAP